MQKTLKVKPLSADRTDPRASIKAKDAKDVAQVEAKEEERKNLDAIGEPLNFGEFWWDQSPSQVFGQALLDDWKGREQLIPHWRFKRAYFTQKIIIDTYFSEKAYDEARVEERRAMAHKYGWKYAALGPNHSIQPHGDEKARAQWPSQMEQLGLVGQGVC